MVVGSFVDASGVMNAYAFDGAKYRQLVFEPVIRALGLENLFPPADEAVRAEAEG